MNTQGHPWPNWGPKQNFILRPPPQLQNGCIMKCHLGLQPLLVGTNQMNTSAFSGCKVINEVIIWQLLCHFWVDACDSKATQASLRHLWAEVCFNELQFRKALLSRGNCNRESYCNSREQSIDLDTVPANDFQGEMTTSPEQLFVLAVLGGSWFPGSSLHHQYQTVPLLQSMSSPAWCSVAAGYLWTSLEAVWNQEARQISPSPQ